MPGRGVFVRIMTLEVFKEAARRKRAIRKANECPGGRGVVSPPPEQILCEHDPGAVGKKYITTLRGNVVNIKSASIT